MKPRIHMTILTIGLIFSFTGINAQIDKMHAIDIVMNNVVQGNQVNFNVLLFPELIKGSDYKLSDFHTLHSPYDNAWLFFIDMFPRAQWDHECKYLFVDEVSGEFTEIKHRIPPNNYWCNWEFVNYPFPYPETNHFTDSIQAVNYNFTPDPHKYAVFLCWNEEEPCRWNNLSHIYCGIKRNYGFMDENIFVLSGSGTINTDSVSPNLDHDLKYNDFDGPCTKDNMQAVFNGLSEIITDDDILFVYATTHGGTIGNSTSYLRLFGEDSIFDFELAAMVEDINCSQKIFGIDACWSGNFIDDLEGTHTVVQTCVGDTLSLITQGGLGFHDMSFWWGTALRGYYPLSIFKPWDNGPKIGEHDSLYTISNIDSTDYNPDSDSGNADGYIQFQEAFNFAHHYASDIRDRNGQNYINHGFRGDLLTLNGIEGRVDTTQNIVGSYLFGRKLTLSPGVTLSKGFNSLNFYLNDSTEILIEDGAKLDINGNSTDIIGCSGESFVTVEGDLRQTRMDFTANPGSIINVRFSNTENDYELDHFSFNNAKISGNCHSLSFEQSDFTNTTLKFSNGDLLITNQNKFINSTVDISNPSSLASYCSITGNSFENTSHNQSPALITIEDYTKFLIENNTIKYRNNRGIELFYAGWDEPGEHAIRNNDTIRYTSSSSPQVSELGIHSYFSNVSIEDNYISNNYYGITGFHGSEIKVLGDSTAKDVHSTQLFENNTQSQCLFSYGSFPTKFNYNVLKDGLSTNHPFIRAVDYDEVKPDTNHTRGMDTIHFHVENNYWVNDTNPSDRLLPLNKYYWRPVWWCPGARNLKSEDIPGEMYAQATEFINGENYLEAESIFKQIIDEYPDNEYSQASLKGLFSLNPALHDTDYTFLKQYCDSLSLNPGDSLLGKTAEWLSIHCNIRDKEYQLAIYSLDSIINNPGTLADSVFALIDLSYVFNEANNNGGSKAALVTKHPDVIPESSKYVIQRKEWIDLLLRPDDNSSQESIDDIGLIENLKTGKILSIHPNPCGGNFNVDYYIDRQGLVSLSIFSSSGQTLAEIQKGNLDKGEYYELIRDLQLPDGIYFIKLSLDNIITDVAKLIITK